MNKLIEKYNNRISRIILDSLTSSIVFMILVLSITVFGLVLIPGVDSNGEQSYLLFSEAFYFMIYTATTIGYGEITDFTYTQQLWVIFSIILSVVGWFYLLSSIVKLVTNKVFQNLLVLRRKIIDIRALRSDYIVMFGYKESYDLIINKLLDRGKSIVMIIEDETLYANLVVKYPGNSIIILNLPYLSEETLIAAGIEKSNVTDVIVSVIEVKEVFDITMLVKSLNEDVIVTTFSKNIEEDGLLNRFGVDNIISSRGYIANDIVNLFLKPKLAEIGEFIHGELVLEGFANIKKQDNPRILIIGGGHIAEFLLNHEGMEKVRFTVIDKKGNIKNKLKTDGLAVEFIRADLFNEYLSDLVDLNDYDVALILLNDDFLNIYISRQLEKYTDLETIIKINEHKNLNVIKKQKPNKILTIDRLESIELENVLTKPDIVEYKSVLFSQDRKYISKYFTYMKKYFKGTEIKEVVVDEGQAFALYNKLCEIDKIDLKVLLYDLEDMGKGYNDIVPLCIVKENRKPILIPFFEEGYQDFDYVIEIGDKLIYVPLNDRAEYIFKFILENDNELCFALDYYGRTAN